ncbi:MAG: hypothetical protein CSA64_04060 [Arachnia propionica]|nr:MAG: hypothetical protein CSA64_04060 [Arachnia propionica]
MSDGSNDWEQQDAPKQESWDKDPGEYGLEVSGDWDDYSSEQGITAPPPPPQPIVDPQDTQLGQAAASSFEPPAMPSEAPESDLAAKAASAAESASVSESVPEAPIAETAAPMAGWASLFRTTPEEPETTDVAAPASAADVPAAADVTAVSMPVVPAEPVADVAAASHDLADAAAAAVPVADVSAAADESVADFAAAVPAASVAEVPAAADVADVAMPVVADEPVADAAAADFVAAAPAASVEAVPAAAAAADVAGAVKPVVPNEPAAAVADMSKPAVPEESVAEAPKPAASDEPAAGAAAAASVAAAAAASTTEGAGAHFDTKPTSVTRWPSLDRMPAPETTTADPVSSAEPTAVEQPQTDMSAGAGAGVAAGWDDAATEVARQPARAAEAPASGQEEAPADSAPVAAAAGAAGVAAAGAALYREDEETRQLPVADPAAEQAALEEKLRLERQARDERLGVVPPVPESEKQEEAKPVRRSTDGFFGSFGLFVLRLVAAAILGVIGYQILTPVDRTVEFLSQTMIPEPRLVAWILGFTLGAMALLLVIGLMQRFVGLLMMLLGIGSLVFIRWGNFLPFVPGQEGFIGDRDLLLAAVGLLLLTLGGGAWGIDGAIRRGRSRRAAAKPNQ